MNSRHRHHDRRPALLILGDLHPEPAQEKRLQKLVRRMDRHPAPDETAIRRLLPEYDCLFACNVQLTPFITELAALDLVVLAESGIVHLDTEQAGRAGVNFRNIPGYSTEAVVQYILRCLLESLRPWEKIFAPLDFPVKTEKIGRGLENLPVGVIGYGLIGKRLTDVLAALGCRVLINTRHYFSSIKATWMPAPQLFSAAQMVVICCTRNQASQGFFGADLLGRLPIDSVLVSVSHRDVFDHTGLLETLQNRPDLTAWLDLDWHTEDDQLLALPNVHLSPHLAFYTGQTLTNRVDSCIDQLEAFLTEKQYHDRT